MNGRFALRDRLAIAFAIALFATYAVFAVVAVGAADRVVATAIDGRLHTIMLASRDIVDIKHGRMEPDAKDREQFNEISAEATGAAILDRSGHIVLQSAHEIPGWLAPLQATGGERYERIDAGGRSVRIYVTPFDPAKPRLATVVIWQSLDLVHDVERTVVGVLAAFGLVLGAGAYVLGVQIARRGLTPLTRIAGIISDIEARDLTQRLGTQPHDDEVGRLAATFDRMLDRLENAFERQRQFTADASHDLRAPLATLRAETDLALRRERTPAEYRAALLAIADDADRLDQLIDTLLAVARSEAGSINLHPVDLGHIAESAIEQVAPFARSRSIAIDIDAARGLTIAGDESLLVRAVLAVLHNAVKFTPAGMTIRIAADADGSDAHLRIRDHGPGFSGAALNHALERFWRDDSARGRSGSGLGLSIVKAVVDRCGGSVELRNAADGGGEVLIGFPLAAPLPAEVEFAAR